MGASTAGDGTGAMERAYGLSGDLTLNERLEVVACRNRPIDAAALRAFYQRLGHTAGREETDLASLATEPVVAAWVGAELVGLARAVSDGRRMAFVEEPVVCERWRSGGTAGALLGLLLTELGAVEEVYLGCDPVVAPAFVSHGLRPTDRVLLRLDRRPRRTVGARR